MITINDTGSDYLVILEDNTNINVPYNKADKCFSYMGQLFIFNDINSSPTKTYKVNYSDIATNIVGYNYGNVFQFYNALVSKMSDNSDAKK